MNDFAMTKRRLFRWSLILAIIVAFAVWLEPTRVVWGWLRGEAQSNGAYAKRASTVSIIGFVAASRIRRRGLGNFCPWIL